MADLTTHSHSMIGSSESEIEQRIRDIYPGAVAVLVYRQNSMESSRGMQK
ncbi:MAG: hypothetical protein ACRDTR_02100 [Rubrobacter sp.]